MICFVGPLPPPTHGMANVNKQMIDLIGQHTKVDIIRVNPPVLARGLKYHLGKFAKAISAIFRICISRIRGSRTFYGSIDDGIGGIFTSLFAFTARLLGMRIYLHHHSFKYIDRQTIFMKAVAAAAGRRACHIVLCEEMGRKLKARYPVVSNVVTVPNSIPVSDTECPSSSTRPEITIGLLANLSFAKGLDDFVSIVEQATKEGMSVRGILAGPVSDSKAAAVLEGALARLGHVLAWRGPVSGQKKSEFFAELDVFVFPTKYEAETYPLVLVEALVHGVPVIATDRGCICSFREFESVDIIPVQRDFVDAALGRLRSMTRTLRNRPDRRHQAAAEGARLNIRNTEIAVSFARSLAHEVAP